MRMLSPLSTHWTSPRRVLSRPLVVDDIFEDFDRLVDGLVRPSEMVATGFLPACDIDEAKDHYLVSFDIPGVKKEDIKIEIQGNTLLIAGERRREFKTVDSEVAIRHERTHGKFERTFELPKSVNVEKIEAQYDNGVLNVVLPKAEAATSRTIQVQTEGGGLLSKLLGSNNENAKPLTDIKVS